MKAKFFSRAKLAVYAGFSGFRALSLSHSKNKEARAILLPLAANNGSWGADSSSLEVKVMCLSDSRPKVNSILLCIDVFAYLYGIIAHDNGDKDNRDDTIASVYWGLWL